MKIYLLPLLTITFIFAGLTMARAGSEIVQCGIPADVSVETDPDYVFCNIYDRQFAYRERRLELVTEIKERQGNFAAPSLEAQAQYKADLEALHDSIDESAE